MKPTAEEIATLTWRARELFTLLADPVLDDERAALVRELEPRPEDYDRVFSAELAATARAFYAELWREPPAWPLEQGRRQVRVSVATVDDLVHRTARGRELPGGYADVADALRPDHLWLCWRYVGESDERSLTFDGLVAIDGRLVWFPKPWRVVPVVALQRMASQWAD